MKVEVADFVEGARNARGMVVVIDVFRAFSLAAYAVAHGVRAIYPVDDIERARLLKRQDPTRLLFGERNARPPDDFDGGNSPALLVQRDLADRELIHTTHAGTQGLVNASQAHQVLTGALVNAAAIVRYVKQQQPQQVTLVRMGLEARERCVEDDLCADLLLARLTGSHYPEHDIRERLRAAPAARKFFDAACRDFAPEGDFDLCVALDRFDFVLRLDTRHQPMRLLPVPVPV